MIVKSMKELQLSTNAIHSLDRSPLWLSNNTMKSQTQLQKINQP